MKWLISWAVAFVVAFPSVVVIAPFVHKICTALKKIQRSDKFFNLNT